MKALFSDLPSAERYVNDVLDSYPARVESVASGQASQDFLEKRYDSPTGREAYREEGDPKGIVRLRSTFSVGVYIVHAGNAKGFSVRTAYPKERRVDQVTPFRAFMDYSNYILAPWDTGWTEVEQIADFAVGSVSAEVRQGAIEYISEKIKSGENLTDMWIGSNSRVSPSYDTARSFTDKVLARLRDPSVQSRAVHRTEELG